MAADKGKNNDVLSQMGKQLDHAEESLQDMQESIAEQKKSRKLIEGEKNKDKGQEPGKSRGEGGGTLGKVAEFLGNDTERDRGRDR